MSAPLITVVIPTYNYSSVLRCAVASVLGQTLDDFELIVVGDGCTDDSQQVVESFGDPRVTWENLPENTGNQGRPNMRALEMARGKYVAYLGHDDLWLPHHLATLSGTLERTGKRATASLVLTFGPPETGLRYIRNLHGRFESFIPGVTMHRREVGLEIGWKHLSELPAMQSTDYDFTTRLRKQLGDEFVPCRQVTLLNFPGLYRPGVYQHQRSDEQEHYLRRMRDDPMFSHTVLIETIDACLAGRYGQPKTGWTGMPSGKPGELVEAMRRFKGLSGDGRKIQNVMLIDNWRTYLRRNPLGFCRWLVLQAAVKLRLIRDRSD